MDKRLGRLPADPSKPRIKLAGLLKTTDIPYPENRDYLSLVSDYPMYLNDRIGDCTCATAGHIIQELTTYGQGSTRTISDEDVLTAYRAVSGFDPTTGANDDGAIVQDVLNYWRKTGIGGHKILAFAEVDYQDNDELRAAMNLFGMVYLGIDFPDTAFDQFDNYEPWDVAPGAQLIGGHAINAGYYDVSDNMWKVVTWGRVQPMTQAFFDQYVEEAWVVISDEWFNAQGKSPTELDMQSLGAVFTQITGEANPFPPVVVENPDDAFAQVAEKWLNEGHCFYKKFQAEIRSWLAERNGS